MLLRPARRDLRIITLGTGRVLIVVGLALCVPAVLGLARGEHGPAAGFVVGACVALLPGLAAEGSFHRHRDQLRWDHGMVIAALSWALAALAGAVPLYLAGHYGSFLDAYFDAMSGFATAGLTVINDLDHVADSVNLWRHMMQFIGGQGLVLLVLSFFTAGGGAPGMYVGEAREEHILPNIVHTARFIWRVALTYCALGTSALWVAVVVAGLPPGQGLLHAVTLFMAAFDTGGFAPTSASVGLYHSLAVEAVLAVLMVAGALSFALHHRLWRGRAHELTHNVEVRTLATTLTLLAFVVTIGLATAGAYADATALFRRGLFHLLSAHTGTGFVTIPGRLFATGWGTLAPAALVLAMAFGAMAGSTAGGIKAIRLALVAKGIQRDIRKLLLPPDALVVASYHSGTRQVLRPAVLRSALMILLLYVALYLLGAFVALGYGYPLEGAVFESTSAAAAVGLSVGVTAPSMETGLKAALILQMWVGRLEFVAVLALFGYVWSLLRGRA